MITITALPYTPNAGWDDTRTCLVGTRESYITKVMAWVQAENLQGAQQIYFLADVVGSGKTALAHTVAEQCFYDGVLASSFFFDRKAGRTSSRDFVFNLARDLGNRIPEVSHRISLALRADPTLALSRPLSHVFKKLVFEPMMHSNIGKHLVIIIDALNEVESGTTELHAILRTQIPNLPGMFRVFVTSRPERSVLHGLRRDIAIHDLAIHDAENYKDVAIFVDHKLQEIASHHSLENWPDARLTAKLLRRAEGLFIWVDTICEYLLHQACYPDMMLEDLLKSMRRQLPPDEKMDNLYSTILAACPWRDPHFLDGYKPVMGALVVQISPLTVDALQQLHGPVPRVSAILAPLGSLITGLRGLNLPARILHSSFTEYVTLRYQGNPKYSINVKAHNRRLAILCLKTLNNLFSVNITGCGYLQDKKTTEIPVVDADFLTEQQWYAVNFWFAHTSKAGVPSREVLRALKRFLSRHFTTWIELLASREIYQSILPILSWLQVSVSLRF
jgi:hypothetical protein